jgi:hypothetical protein
LDSGSPLEGEFVRGRTHGEVIIGVLSEPLDTSMVKAEIRSPRAIRLARFVL